jgi:uncharacterized membrane protein YcaP (DUF421 family)
MLSPLSGVDWSEIFAFERPLVETVARGTATYLMLMVVLRFPLRRLAGAVSIADLLVVVLLADAAQNAMAAEYKSVGDGALLVGTLVFWNYALDWLGFRVRFIQRLIEPPPLPLIENGELKHRNLRSELITKDELMSTLRSQGIEDIEDVKRACMESNGQISVVRFDGKRPERKKRPVPT